MHSNSKLTTPVPRRTSFSGIYAFQIQGWLRAHNDKGLFLRGARPEIDAAVVMAGFQSPADPDPKKAPDVKIPLPQQTINSGYYPYAVSGVITYAPDGSVTGYETVCVGGNTNAKNDSFHGNYELLGSDGTYTIFDDVKMESATYRFFLVHEDREILFMDIGGAPKRDVPDRVVLATGIQKLLSSIVGGP